MKTYVRNESGRLFENDFLEKASRVHPATPFIFYIPIVLAILAWDLYSGITAWGMAAAAVPAGWVTWQVMEYSIHRYFFHWEGNGPFTRRLHEIVHGYHHKYPDDGDRLVMPLGASIPLALVIGGLLWAVSWPAAMLPYFCGIVAGYLWYDFLHYASHHFKPRTNWGKAMRSHHLSHHFADTETNYGISHKWLDRLLGTLKARQTRED
jgi:sterol desaturase/sphingolipid hydroxylase (fatty acid hydroxylase superfamily)